MEVLSEHLCQGWLEGYLLTGRHGLFNCYEAFIHIVDSMFNQHAKWLQSSKEIPWRKPIASLNYLLSSHVWRQDHNGFSHQDPGFLDVVVNKKPAHVRVYLPPDANTLLSVADHCLRSQDYVNVIVAGKQPALNWLSMDEAVAHCTRGVGMWPWASTDDGGVTRRRPRLLRRRPDARDPCRGGHPAPRAAGSTGARRKRRRSDAADRREEHPHGMSNREFDALFTTNKPIVFAFHGYPWLIHRLTYRRTNHPNLHVRGFIEEGTTTTPFDMVMLNNLDRFHLVMDVIDRVPGLADRAGGLRQEMVDKRLAARAYTRELRRGRSRDHRLALAGLILVLNAGSSTLKASLIEPGTEEPVATTTETWAADRADDRSRHDRAADGRPGQSPRSLIVSSTAARVH